MKNKDLQILLSELDPELNVYACCGSSGCTYEVGHPHEHIKSDTDDIGSMCTLPNNTKVISLYIGH